MSISDHFTELIKRIETEIEQNSEEYLLDVDAQELTEYFAQKYSLPLIEIDENRKITLEKSKSRYGRVPLKVYYPIVPKSNLETVVKREASRRYISGGVSFQLQGDWLVLFTEMRDSTSLKSQLDMLKEVIGWKNNDVKGGNERIRREIKNYLENRQNSLKQEYEQLDSIVGKFEVPLDVKKEKPLPVVDFGVREELVPLIKPEAKRQKDLVLDAARVAILIGYIRNSCISFEKTPKVFSKLEEEHLRDVILGNLNAIFRGEATGETFSKLGKTDIHLRIGEGSILIIECKFWDGKAKYGEGINQLFRYLTWRENYGILVTFATRCGFTKVIQEAKEATQEHVTFISGSTKECDSSAFITGHRFPEDAEKRVEIHHLLFNLFAGGDSPQS
jgi:hypothetical protein